MFPGLWDGSSWQHSPEDVVFGGGWDGELVRGLAISDFEGLGLPGGKVVRFLDAPVCRSA